MGWFPDSKAQGPGAFGSRVLTRVSEKLRAGQLTQGQSVPSGKSEEKIGTERGCNDRKDRASGFRLRRMLVVL